MNNSPTSVRYQEQIGSVVSGIGLILAAQVWTTSRWGILGLLLTRGPIEVCASGILIWLTAKWRRVHNRAEAHRVTA